VVDPIPDAPHSCALPSNAPHGYNAFCNNMLGLIAPERFDVHSDRYRDCIRLFAAYVPSTFTQS
jgi:hypothetical protein